MNMIDEDTRASHSEANPASNANAETNASEDNDNSGEELGMAELLAQEELAAAQAVSSEPGSFVSATVVSITADGALVDIGQKAEALIPAAEYGGKNPPFAVGDTVSVVKRQGRSEGLQIVSWKAARDRMAWEEIQQFFEKKTPIKARIRSETKGGLLVECENGLVGFMPASQVDVRMSRDMKKWKGQEITAYVVEFDPRKNNLVLSRRQWVSEENQKKKTETLSTLQAGEVRKGTVTGITSFGAFVDIGGIEGLLHIGELEWAHTNKVSDVLKVGQEIEVKILKFDAATEKVSLSRKELLPHPWDSVEARFPAGAVVQGKVTSVTDFGAFVEVAPHVEGLLHASEIAWGGEQQKPKELLKVGQQVNVKVLGVNREKEKISLSMKRVGDNPWETLSQRYPVGSVVKGTVSSLVPFGAFVRLAEGMEGLIHISDFSWSKRIRHPEDVLKVGQEIEVKVLEIDANKEKISFGLKQLKSSPFERFTKGAKVKATVTQITDAGAVIELDPEVEGFVPVSEVSSDKFEKIEAVLKVGDVIEGKIIAVEPRERKIHVSIKQLERELQRAAVKKYSGKAAGPALGDLLEQ